MKKPVLILSLLFLLPFIEANSQWINSLSISPQFPSSVDTIYIYADCSFQSGSCDQHVQGVAPNGNTIMAYATHCLGMLTFICSYTDTFKLDPLSAGNYLFDFQLNAGSLPAPCNPGIVPGPRDTLRFTVTSGNGIRSITSSPFSIYPNPANGNFFIKKNAGISQTEEQSYLVYDPFGKVVTQGLIHSSTQELDLSELNEGIYLLQILQGQHALFQTVKLVLIH